jgi:Restriction endonuclease
MDVHDLYTRQVSRRAILLSMGTGGLSLALGGVGVVDGQKPLFSGKPAKAMIVTTSSYASTALELAMTHGIRLIDGLELVTMMQDVQPQ